MLKCHICNSDHAILFHNKVFGMLDVRIVRSFFYSHI